MMCCNNNCCENDYNYGGCDSCDREPECGCNNQPEADCGCKQESSCCETTPCCCCKEPEPEYETKCCCKVRVICEKKCVRVPKPRKRRCCCFCC